MTSDEFKLYKEFMNYWKNKDMNVVCTPMIIGFKADLEILLNKLVYELDCRD